MEEAYSRADLMTNYNPTHGSGVVYTADYVLEMSVRIGFGLYQSCSLGCGSVGGWLGPGSVWMRWCESILCVDGRSRYLYIVLSGYLRILDASSVQSCCTLSIYAF